jgi:Fic family protein
MPDQKDSGATSEALLRALIRLELEAQRERNEEITIADQILILQDSGLAQSQAARILGIPLNQVPSYIRNASNKKLLAKHSRRQKSTSMSEEEN